MIDPDLVQERKSARDPGSDWRPFGILGWQMWSRSSGIAPCGALANHPWLDPSLAGSLTPDQARSTATASFDQGAVEHAVAVLAESTRFANGSVDDWPVLSDRLRHAGHWSTSCECAAEARESAIRYS